MKTVLEEALELTSKDRHEEYGDVKQSFFNAGIIATVLCEKTITARDIAKILIAVKLSREVNIHKRDTLVDVCGYTRLLSILEGDENND